MVSLRSACFLALGMTRVRESIQSGRKKVGQGSSTCGIGSALKQSASIDTGRCLMSMIRLGWSTFIRIFRPAWFDPRSALDLPLAGDPPERRFAAGFSAYRREGIIGRAGGEGPLATQLSWSRRGLRTAGVGHLQPTTLRRSSAALGRKAVDSPSALPDFHSFWRESSLFAIDIPNGS